MLTITNLLTLSGKACRRLLIPLVTFFVFGLSACGGGGTGLEGVTNILGGDQSSQDSDPVAVSVPVAYVKRSLIIDEDGNPIQADILRPRNFNGGARLYVRSFLSASAAEVLVAGGPLYDIKDLSPSFDGTKLVFAMRGPINENLDQNDDDQPTWNIWEYTFSSDSLRMVIQNSAEAEDGHDINPRYLPGDKRIVFSSTRQKGSQDIQTNEATFLTNPGIFSALTDTRSEGEGDDDIGEAFVLHTMNIDQALIDSTDELGGQRIQQITYNQSHDLQPTVLRSGKIAFLRWDAAEGLDQLSLYTVNPDGSEMNFLYGFHDQNAISISGGTDTSNATFFDIAQMPDNRIIAVLKHRDNTDANDELPVLGGQLIAIDTESFTEPNEPTTGGQTIAYTQSIPLDETISSEGYFNSVFPLNDGTNNLLVTWSICRLNDAASTNTLFCTPNNLNLPGVTEADPFYSVRLFNPSTGTLSPRFQPAVGEIITDIIALEDRTLSPIPILEELNDSTGYGTLHIRSIYDFSGEVGNTLNADGSNPNTTPIIPVSIADQANPGNFIGASTVNTYYSERRARFLRVVKAVSIPDDEVHDFDDGNNGAFGVSQARGMRQILGYTPIEPDGSVKVQIPADVAFQIEIVDSTGKRLPEFDLHRSWLQLASGEERECAGCHTPAEAPSTANPTPINMPHGRPDFEAVSAHDGAASATEAYPNTPAAYFAEDEGDTMAEIESRVESRTRALVPDLIYSDIWTDDTVVGLTKEANIDLRYVEDGFIFGDTPRVAAPPTATTCLSTWQRDCRIIINYEANIQPLWEADRFETAGDPTSANRPCVLCHTAARNAAGNPTQIAAGQLELTAELMDGSIFVRSYSELLQVDAVTIVSPLAYVFRDELHDLNTPPTPGDTSDDTLVSMQQFLISDDNGTPDDSRDDTFVRDEGDLDEEIILTPSGIDGIPLVETAVNNQEPNLLQVRYGDNGIIYFQQDDPANPGTLITALDNSGNPIPVTEPLTTATGDAIDELRMNAGSAAASRFFDVMNNTVTGGSVDHSLYMSADELRLISEWLDIGAQYYNNPFDAPRN